MYKPRTKRLARDLARIAATLPEGSSFVLWNYPDSPPCSLNQLSQHLGVAMSTRYPQGVSLLGISFGGVVAARLSALMPGHFGKLVLISSALGLSDSGQHIVRSQIEAVAKEDTKALLGTFANIYRSRWRNIRFALFTRLVGPWLGRFLNDPATVQAYLELLETAHEDLVIDQSGTPTLILGGRDDQIFGERMMQDAIRSIKHAELVLIHGETHMLVVERPDKVRAALDCWL
ncbi:alpha/beta fold hydrolase [Pseudomonas sp. SID14000]|uniref:alpha/beta fold hydrolase n=1 Tax=Pseudomonas sp. SID14000 TaxID=1986221 RepID=UPI0014832E1F|nr:alpha/beta hydrolase [Pseudomonas sp. SID14000]